MLFKTSSGRATTSAAVANPQSCDNDNSVSSSCPTFSASSSSSLSMRRTGPNPIGPDHRLADTKKKKKKIIVKTFSDTEPHSFKSSHNHSWFAAEDAEVEDDVAVGKTRFFSDDDDKTKPQGLRLFPDGTLRPALRVALVVESLPDDLSIATNTATTTAEANGKEELPEITTASTTAAESHAVPSVLAAIQSPMSLCCLTCLVIIVAGNNEEEVVNSIRDRAIAWLKQSPLILRNNHHHRRIEIRLGISGYQTVLADPTLCDAVWIWTRSSALDAATATGATSSGSQYALVRSALLARKHVLVFDREADLNHHHQNLCSHHKSNRESQQQELDQLQLADSVGRCLWQCDSTLLFLHQHQHRVQVFEHTLRNLSSSSSSFSSSLPPQHIQRIHATLLVHQDEAVQRLGVQFPLVQHRPHDCCVQTLGRFCVLFAVWLLSSSSLSSGSGESDDEGSSNSSSSHCRSCIPIRAWVERIDSSEEANDSESLPSSSNSTSTSAPMPVNAARGTVIFTDQRVLTFHVAYTSMPMSTRQVLTVHMMPNPTLSPSPESSSTHTAAAATRTTTTDTGSTTTSTTAASATMTDFVWPHRDNWASYRIYHTTTTTTTTAATTTASSSTKSSNVTTSSFIDQAESRHVPSGPAPDLLLWRDWAHRIVCDNNNNNKNTENDSSQPIIKRKGKNTTMHTKPHNPIGRELAYVRHSTQRVMRALQESLRRQQFQQPPQSSSGGVLFDAHVVDVPASVGGA